MRAHFQRPIQDGSGNLLLDATVTVYEAGTLIPISATMYRSPDSDEELVNPFNPANGVISFFLDTPQSVAVGVRRGTGVETINDYLVVPRMSILLDEEFRFSVPSDLAAQVGTQRWYVEHDCLVTSVRASLGTAADADVVVDLNVNGASLFVGGSAPQPTIPTGGHTVMVSPDTDRAPLTAGDYLTMDIDMVGSSDGPGNGLTVQVRTSREA